MSLLHFLYYVRSAGGIKQLVETRGGAQHEHIVGGTAQVCTRLAEAIRTSGCGQVHTGCPVAHVGDWDAAAVAQPRANAPAFPVTVVARRAGTDCLDGAGTTITVKCQRVIVAIPPSMCTRIHFTPQLPAVRRQLHARVLMPCMSKFVLRYAAAWWRDSGMSGEGVRYQASASSPICTAFDYCQPMEGGSGHHAALVGFAAANVSLSLTRLSPAERKAAVVRSFVRLFGPQAANFTAYYELQWESEEWTGGCPVNVFPAGQFCRFARTLRAACGRVHWAGTETATVWTGYMDGAAQSGRRAATEVADALNAALARRDGDAGLTAGAPAAQAPAAVSSGEAVDTTRSSIVKPGDDGYESGRHPHARRKGLHHCWHIAGLYNTWIIACAAVAAAVGVALALARATN